METDLHRRAHPPTLEYELRRAHCRLGVHCPTCRSDRAWRRSAGMPEVCRFHGRPARGDDPTGETPVSPEDRCIPCEKHECPAKRKGDGCRRRFIREGRCPKDAEKKDEKSLICG